ncbi:MAG: class I SAM-dependent methyltransferase [Desulfatibacillaceae bacterium]
MSIIRTDPSFEDKRHWYDGWLYATFYDPFEKRKRDLISRYIEPGSTVLDVACGTGALAFSLADRCEKVVGVELSRTMVRFAGARQRDSGPDNVEFVHGDATCLDKVVVERFDYATMALGLHEMPETVRIDALRSMAEMADTLVLADFLAPQPFNLRGGLNTLMEFFIGGPKNFVFYREYICGGGLDGLLERAGLAADASAVEHESACMVVRVPVRR